MTHLNFMRNNQLYPLLKTLPKGVLHHLHFDCAEDEEFVFMMRHSTASISSLIPSFIWPQISKLLDWELHNRLRQRDGFLWHKQGKNMLMRILLFELWQA